MKDIKDLLGEINIKLFCIGIQLFCIIIILAISSCAHAEPVGGVNFAMNTSSPIDLTPVYQKVNDILFNAPSSVMNQTLIDKLKERLEEYRLEGEKILDKREELKDGWNLVFTLVEEGELPRAGKQLDIVYSVVNQGGEELIAFHPSETVRTIKEQFRGLVNKLFFYIRNEPRNSPVIKTVKRQGEALLEHKPYLLSGWQEVFILLEEGEDKAKVENQLQLIYYASGSSPVGNTFYSSSQPVKKEE